MSDQEFQFQTHSDYPAISVIVNTYNRPVMLRRALDSVFRQTHPDFEVIVVHDGPADDATVAVFEEYTSIADQRCMTFVPFQLDENSGYQCQPKNIATQFARGDYIAYLDDDNEWLDHHLMTLHAAIEEGRSWPDFVYGRREYVVDPPMKEEDAPRVGEAQFIPWTEESIALLQQPDTNFIDTSDTLIAKGALWRMFLATGRMWNEEYRRFGDWELFCRGVHFCGWRGRGVDKVVQRYHWHGANLQLTRSLNETPVQKSASVQ